MRLLSVGTALAYSVDTHSMEHSVSSVSRARDRPTADRLSVSKKGYPAIQSIAYKEMHFQMNPSSHFD
jgi:hypothetical protein